VPARIRAARGNHHPDRASPPQHCIICAGERPSVSSSGQRRIILAEPATAGHRSQVREVEPAWKMHVPMTGDGQGSCDGDDQGSYG
jgi:hypothetical protein